MKKNYYGVDVVNKKTQDSIYEAETYENFKDAKTHYYKSKRDLKKSGGHCA